MRIIKIPMPSKSRKRGSKRRFRKRNARRTTSITNDLGFPDTKLVKLRYVGNNLQVTTGLTPAYRLFRGNSGWDPDQTGSGHKPLAWDQWSAFYDKYLILGCAWKATFVNGGTNDHFKCAVIPKDENSVVTKWSTIAERQYAKIRYGSPTSTETSVRTIKGYMSTKKILGLKSVSTQNQPYTALVTTNPAEEFYIHAYTQAVNEVSAFTVFINIELTYYVRFFDRKPLLQS